MLSLRSKDSFMGLELTWRPHVLASGLHAAEAIARSQPLADSRLAAALEEPALRLAAEIDAAGIPAARFWGHLIPLAAKTTGRRQLVETALVKTAGRTARFEVIVANLNATVAAIESALQAALPNLAEELALRERPLREQWEARGPGMLERIGELTDESLIVSSCEALLVHPALGGAGEAHLAYNSLRIEAVLANPVAELPEAVRLAWLIAQLHLDLPIHSESIHADRLPHVARYAMLPPALMAAESVELARFEPETIAQAIAAWHLAVPSGVDAAILIAQWWQTYQETRPPWNVALAALDQMFG
jgi:hypothetical protein